MSRPVDRLIARHRTTLDAPEHDVVGAVRAVQAETFGALEIDVRVVLAAIADAEIAGMPLTVDRLPFEPRYRRLQVRLADAAQRFVAGVLSALLRGQLVFARLGGLDALAQLTALGLTVPRVPPITRPAVTTETALRELIDGLARQAVRLVEAEVEAAIAPPNGPRPPRSELLRFLDDQATDARTRTLIRTETMRAYRTATRDRHLAAGDALQGVQWIAALSPRTCLACLHRHGTVFPVGYVMESHPNCRCSLAPLAVGTPADVPLTGEAWFARQPEAVQRQRLGAAFDAYRDGRVTLGDFVGVRESERWGRSVQERSATAVLRRAG